MNIGGITIKDSAKVDKIYRSSRRVYLLYNKNKLQIRKKKKIKKIIVNRNVTIFQTTKNQPKYQQFKMVDETCEEDSSLFFFSHDQEEHVRRATCWTIPLSKGITIRARRATLFQSGSLVSRGKKTVGSRNPLEDQRGARKKCKNKIDAHAQCFHAGEFSAFVRPDLKELFWRRTRFEEEE